MNCFVSIVISAIVIVKCVLVSRAQPQVDSPMGRLSGFYVTTRHGRNISAFLGVPFGEPPIGYLRFRSPVPAKPWKGVLRADQDSPPCPQVSIVDFKEMSGAEDCLYLNVYSPFQFNNNNNSQREWITGLPVLAYLHGGGFLNGNCTMETVGPTYLLDKDLVFVTINYRLTVLGFLSTYDEAAPGNFGLKDQLLALKWIQQNIAAFGGDPTRVTLWGQSAGSISVHLHSLSSKTDGLFHQYIMASGNTFTFWGFNQNPEYSTMARKLGNYFHCYQTNTSLMVDCLREVSANDLVHTDNLFSPVARLNQMAWGPTNEPDVVEDAFIVQHPGLLVKQNKQKDLPFMAGSVKNEGLVVAAKCYQDNMMYNIHRMYAIPIIRGLVNLVSPQFNNISLEIAQAVKLFCFGDTVTNDKDLFLKQLADCEGNGFFHYPLIKVCDHASEYMRSPIYMYIFEYRGVLSYSSRFIDNNRNLGVNHCDDLLYLLPNPSSHYRLGNFERSPTDFTIVDKWVDMYSSFVINRKPETNYSCPSDLWEPYQINRRHLVVQNNTRLSMRSSCYPGQMEFWRIIRDGTYNEKYELFKLLGMDV